MFLCPDWAFCEEASALLRCLLAELSLQQRLRQVPHQRGSQQVEPGHAWLLSWVHGIPCPSVLGTLADSFTVQ